MAINDVVLKVAGQTFTGWKSVQVDRAIDALVGSFRLTLSDRWPGAPESWGIRAGDACQILLDGETVMTAWIDRAAFSISPDRHPVVMSGMEKTIDLTDCSAIHTPGSWTGRRLEQISADLTAPFGIKVKALVSTGAVFPAFALQQGESVFEAISRMARQRGVLPVTNADGDLELIRPGQARAGFTLAYGENLEEIAFEDDYADRFSDYVLKGYARDGASRPKASAKDAGVTRYRPLLIVHDDDSTPGNLADRARHEATIRAGRGQRTQATVTGWRDSAGELYRPDRLAAVRAGVVGVEGERLIHAVSYRADDRGRRTVLSLAPKEAFSLQAIPAAPTRRRSR